MSAKRLFWAVVLAESIGISLPGHAAEEKRAAGKSPAELFAELDKNGDGKLTADEVPDAQKRFFNRLLRVADGDKDGALTSAEFAAGLKPDELQIPAGPNLAGMRGGPGQFDPRQIFQRFDRNRDGKLELDEIPEQARPRFQPLFDRLQKTELTRDEFVQEIERARGGDGATKPAATPARPAGLSKEDLQKVLSRFDELDRNKDGFLDAGELFGEIKGTEGAQAPQRAPGGKP